jgi:hypothetical protein
MHFLEQAEKIRDMTASLKKVQADDIKSVFINSMIEKRDEVIPDLKLIADRYETSGNAMRVYGDVLDSAKEMAKQARADSWAAHRDLIAAQQAQAAANPTVMTPGGAIAVAPPVPVGPVIGPAPPDYEEDIRLAKAALDRADALLEEAKELRDRAAGRARNELDEANHDDLKNPNRGFFSSPIGGIVDSIKNFPKNVVTLSTAVAAGTAAFLNDPAGALGGAIVGVAKWTVDSFSSLETFSSHLGLIGGALGIAALFFPPTSLIATIGFAISATKLATDTYLAATGRASWGDVTMSAIGMAAFGAARVAANAQRTRALTDTMDEVTRLKTLGDKLEGGLDMTNRLNLSRAEKVIETLEKQAAAKDALPRMARWANTIKDPAAPAKSLLEFSGEAQRISRINTVVDAYNKVDDPLGKLGAVNSWADELTPIAKDYVP